VWLVGFFRTGGTRPGPAVVYDVSTDAVAPLEYFGASGAFAQDGRMVFGMSLGFWAMAHDAIGTQQVAFGWGRVSSADATTLTDLAARWDDDAFNALFEGSGMEVRVLRDGAVDQQEEITDVSGGTQLSVASWPDETPMAGQDYFLVPPDWSGVADSGSDVRTILDADVVLKAFDDAQAGTVVALVRPSTGAVQVVSLSTNGYQSLSLWDVDGRLLAAYPAEIDVAEGDLYVVGSWVWTWRQTLVPEGGRMVRARRMILDATAEGADGGDMIVVVRIYASGTDRGEPTLQDTLVLDSSGSNDLILDDWVQLPRYWGRVVWLEIVGVCKDQRVRVRGVEVEVEER